VLYSTRHLSINTLASSNVSKISRSSGECFFQRTMPIHPRERQLDCFRRSSLAHQSVAQRLIGVAANSGSYPERTDRHNEQANRYCRDNPRYFSVVPRAGPIRFRGISRPLAAVYSTEGWQPIQDPTDEFATLEATLRPCPRKSVESRGGAVGQVRHKGARRPPKHPQPTVSCRVVF